jgi:short-subunit dehydrogenase
VKPDAKAFQEQVMPSILIAGAGSDIARATAKVFGSAGWDLILTGRDMEGLSGISSDLSVRLGRPVQYFHYDVTDENHRLKLWDSLETKPDAVLIAIGMLGDQELARSDPDLAGKITEVNYTGLLPLLIQASDAFEKRGSGTIVGISSVAGDRGRSSNYTYGAAKAALTVYLSGLRNRLASKGVQVITIKPGFVRTSMTEGMKLPGLLTASPEEVAQRIYKAVLKKNNVVYVKWYWRWIMSAIKLLPEFIFKKTNM